ncbi:MAG: hypothetical protein HCAMLNBO_02242 [Candidatus Brocadia fulgida]|nr:hypothetical protein [Candidatus Brocadia fulgida]
MPSCPAILTSSSPAGISSSVLRYMTETSFAPSRSDERAQSMAVKPPPRTATLSGTVFRSPRLVSFMKVTPCKTPSSSSPGISSICDRWAPVARYTALYSLNKASNASGVSMGLFKRISTPSAFIQFTASSIVSRGSRYGGIPTLSMPPATGSAS